MAKKKLNKNLVAALTVAAIFCTVAVVVLATYSAAQRDPETLAAKAADAAKAGNLRRAAQLYVGAFRVRKEARYLVEASKAAYQDADFLGSLDLLRQAVAQEPENVAIVSSLLERYYELTAYGSRPTEGMRDAADKILKIEPDNVLALISRGQAANWMSDQDPALAQQARESIERAVQKAPSDWRLALVRAEQSVRSAILKAREQWRAGDQESARKTLEGGRAEAVRLLSESLAGNPKQPRLVTEMSRYLREMRRDPEAIETLRKAAEAMPDSPEVLHALASVVLQTQLVDNAANPPPKDQYAALLASTTAMARRAVELEPASYETYGVLASLHQLEAMRTDRWEKDRLAVIKESLDIFVKAHESTVKLKSVRAVMSAFQRAQMIAQGFDTAMYHYISEKDKDIRAAALTYAKGFQDRMSAEFKETVFVPMMQGRLAVAEADFTRAIAAFREADDKSRADMPFYSYQAKEQLALLYTQTNTPGLALRYTDESLALAEQFGITPKRGILLNRANLLVVLDRAKDALDYLDTIPVEGDDSDRAQIRARALAATGQGDRAAAELVRASVGRNEYDVLVDEARLAIFREDLEGGAAKLRAALEKFPDNGAALRSYVQVMSALKREEEAAAFCDAQIERTKNPDVLLGLRTCKIVLTEKDEAKRDAALLELIAQMPDACQRSTEYYNFWSAKRDFVKAQTYLDELEKCRDGSSEVLELQFNLALRQQKWERAEQFIARLAKANADRANGAIYRGQLKMARGDADGAAAEYRIAERELPTDVAVKIRVADALIRVRPPRYEEAMALLKLALEFNPRDFMANRLLYACYEQIGQREEGMEYLQRAASINKADEFIQERLRLLEEAKDPSKGIAWREEQTLQRPDDYENLTRLVELYGKVDDEPSRARVKAIAAAALQRGASDLQFAAVVAKYFARHKLRAEGEEFLRSFVNNQKGTMRLDGMLLLGRFYEMLGDVAAAGTQYLDVNKQVSTVIDGDPRGMRRGRAAASMALAEFYDRSRQTDKMVEAHREALKHLDAGEDASTIQDVRLKVAKGLMAEGLFKEAEEAVVAFQKDFPRDIRGTMTQAELILRRNPDDKALARASELLSRVLSQQPDQVWCLYMRGRVNVALKREAEASADLLRVKSIAPRAFNFEPRLELTRLYERRGEVALAENELRELWTEVPDSRVLAENLIRFYIRTDQLAKGIDFVGQLVARYPKEAYWPYQQGLLLMRREEFSAAISSFEAGLRLTDARNSPIVEEYLAALIRANRARDTIAAIPNLRPEVVTPRVRLILADAFSKTDQRPRSIEQVALGISSGATRHTEEVAAVAEGAVGLIGPAEVIAILRQSLEKAADAPEPALRIRTVLGRMLVMSADSTARAEGIRLADEVVAAAPPGSSLMVSAHLVRALGLDGAGDIAGARKAYEEALKSGPEDVTALNNYAYLLSERENKPAEAMAWARKAADLAPNNVNVLDTLGWIQYRGGALAEAESTLGEAVRIDPTNLAARYHLGLTLAKREKRPEARKAFDGLLAEAQKVRNEEYVQKAQKELDALR